MATYESKQRMERRQRQRQWEAWNRDPEVIALRRYLAARQRYEQRHPFSGRLRPLLRLHCMAAGILQGGPTPGGATLHEAARLAPMLGLARIWP